ncbi:Clp protease N-terminal domain-containing protein [Paractinoplanes globisporus]|uniref:Clp protease N-terminal domain-containing protein n=1 Tax=Paractinoplanes globisporus TaxID=113565 RepID=A0ABW6WBS6_9ACTN|nr:Clp protease N-terminal domain-containing protein [Actinoplanes globisporus]
MFERFTDRARRVVVLAQEEARMLRHNYIGSEHLLLGLLHEGEGHAAKVLNDVGVTLGDVRAQVEDIIGLGQLAPSGHIPFTPRAKKIIEFSLLIAMRMGHNYVGTEHELFGLVLEGDGVGVQVLTRLGVDLERLHEHSVTVLAGYPGTGAAPGAWRDPDPYGYKRYTDRARRAIVLAVEEAQKLGDSTVDTEHCLLGLVREPDGAAGQALERLGFSYDDVLRDVTELLRQEQPPPGAARSFGYRSHARTLLDWVPREAQRLGHDYIGTEHLLLGLVWEVEGLAGRVLAGRGVDLDRVRREIIPLLGGDTPGRTPSPSTSASSGLDRFTDRGRRVLVLAQEEARLQIHNYIGTEHLTLALIHEGEGIAAKALESSAVSLEMVRARVAEIIGPGTQEPAEQMPFSPRARSVLNYAVDEARQLGNNFVNTEHILLAIIREGEGVGVEALTGLGVDLDQVREQVMALLNPQTQQPTVRVTFERFTDRAKRLIVLSQDEARMLGHNYIGPEHLLLGLIHEGLGVAAKALESMGIALGDLRSDVEEIIGRGDGAPAGHIPFTARAKRVLEFTMRKSLELHHNYIGTEHILLGLIGESATIAAQVLTRRGVTLDRAQSVMLDLLDQYAAGGSATLAADAVEEWARSQAATVVPGDGQTVELFHGASGLVLLGRSGLHLPLGFVADVLRLTRAGSQPDERLAALHALPNVQRLRALAWPPAARVGFAALLGAGMPADPRLVPPAAFPAELRNSLLRTVTGVRIDDPAPAETAEILNAGRRVSDGVVTTLLVVGPGAVAADPALPLRLRHGADAVPALSGPQRALLEWTGARAVVPARSRSASTAPGPGLTGISRRGQLTNLLPSQLVLPPAILRHRFADRALLYRLHETETQPPVETVRILLDTSPPTFGSIGVALRIVVQAIVSALWQARQVPTLVYLDQPGLETAVRKPSDLGAAWTHQSLEPVDLGPVLVAAQRSEQPSVLLTQHRLVADHGIVATDQLRLVTAQLPGDDPDTLPSPPFHAHLAAEPTKAQLAAAVRTALAPQAR